MKVRCNPADLDCFAKCLPNMTFEADDTISRGHARNEKDELVIAQFGGALGPLDPSRWRYLNCACLRTGTR